MPEFEAQGVAVYALSYDEEDALRDFRDAHGISYTLLSDPESAVIRDFGILNTLIDPTDHPWFGIPYPGTYILDEQGKITHKFFDSNLAVRAGPEQLLRALRGKVDSENGDPKEDSATTDVTPNAPTQNDVEVDLTIDGHSLARTVQKDLVARFKVPPGKHVYASPAPTGSVAAAIVLDKDERLALRPTLGPESVPHTLVATGETFEVHHGEFELRLPITLNSAATADVTQITISGEVCWQSCDDNVCDIPAKQRFELNVPVVPATAVALGSKKGAALEPNAMAHFQRMSARRQK